MTQVPILNGIQADVVGDFRTRYPRNLVPVPKQTGISAGYLRPADGIATFGTGPGVDRGGIAWNGAMYRVMGTKLVRVSSAGVATELGDVGAGGYVSLDYSQDRLILSSGGRLYYYADGLTQVTDGDLGLCVDACWIAGYTLSTDGTFLVVTELNDPSAVNPLKYGSAESDPDPIKGVGRLRNEAYAFGRYTTEAFQNVGGDFFPFARIDGAQVPKGIVGTHAKCEFLETFAIVGGGRNEPVSVYLLGAGSSTPIATAEIERILSEYTEAELESVVVESRVDRAHRLLYIHLPDQTLVYDAAASSAVEEPVWFSVDSGVADRAQYRGRGFVYAYGEWICGDPTSSSIGKVVKDVSTHYGSVTGWDFGTMVVYNEGMSAIVHELELIALPGRVTGSPVIWTSYSNDGELWSTEKAISAGTAGQRRKRLTWRDQGVVRQYRMQQFRGTSDAHMAFARLEAKFEALAA